MNTEKNLSLGYVLRGAILVSIMASAPSIQAVPPTFWTGPNTNYVQNPAGSGQDILVAGAVSIDRAGSGRLYNGIKEASHSFAVPSPSPTDTEWATATPSVIADLTTAQTLVYTNFDGWVGPKSPGTSGIVTRAVVGKAAVLHLIAENIYMSIKFSAWGSNGIFGVPGGFAYTRSTPAVAAPTPTANIFTPANNSTFAAPATFTIQASASVSSGSVTNVSFFNETNTLLGSAKSVPFAITASNLTAGVYHLTAVATAAGVSGTSSVVTINVTAATPTVSITAPVAESVFGEPADVNIAANATVNGGTVTNVSFFNNTTSLLGMSTASPFGITASGLTAGSYNVTAVASASGISATSTAVHFSVVTPVPISTSSPTVSNNQFSFDYTVNPGLTYVVQSSSNLAQWSGVVTNTPISSPAHFTDSFSLDSNFFYRVTRKTN